MLSNLLVSSRNCGTKVKCNSRKAISDFALPFAPLPAQMNRSDGRETIYFTIVFNIFMSQQSSTQYGILQTIRLSFKTRTRS